MNVTLIFSLDRHDEVIDAYLDGLEQSAASGGDLSTIASVASFFVSRVDTETDRRLPEARAARQGRGRQRQARVPAVPRHVRRPRWEALAAKGARLQRPLWASTSTKNPAYSPTLYVDELVGRDTVNTLAQASIDALHSGEGDLRADTVTEDVDEAQPGHGRSSPTPASTSTT